MSALWRAVAPVLTAAIVLAGSSGCTEADLLEVAAEVEAAPALALLSDGKSGAEPQVPASEKVSFRTAWGSRVIVVLGSSTAAGVGVKRWDAAWVERYRAHLRQSFPTFEVVNLALGGATTYEMQPSDYAPPAGRAQPNTTHNVTHALTFNPAAIIINMPTNDAQARIPVWEQLQNYGRVHDFALARGIPTWVATTQPRNFPDVAQRNDLMAARDAIRARFGGRSLDFWSQCAQWDGTIRPGCDSGDGIHLSDEGHGNLAQQVLNARIPETVLSTRP